MSLPRRAVLKTSGNLIRNQPRRYSSHGSHEGPVKESFGTGFYLTLAVFPTAYIGYKLSRANGETQPYLTRLLQSYDHWLDTYHARNTLHTKMVEQAGMDRLLFYHSPTGGRAGRTVDVKFQEAFNVGSPYNVPAGQGSINLDKIIAHYEKQNAEQEEKRIENAKKEGRL